MTQAIHNNQNLRGVASCCSPQCNATSESQRSDSSLVKRISAFMQGMVEYTAEVLLDWGRGTDYVCQWVGYSGASSAVKSSAESVKGVTDRFNLFGVFCEMTTATRDVMTKQAENVSQAVNLVGGYIASTAEFSGRLHDLNIIQVSKNVSASVGTAGALAEASLGLNGIREGVQDLKEGKSISGSMLKIAKNTALFAIGLLSTIAAGFVTLAASFPKLSICLLTAGTAYLALKVAQRFHEALGVLPPPGLAHSV